MESFISTMETNALMGMNVARLIVDDLVGKQASKLKGQVDQASEDEELETAVPDEL